MKKPQFRYQKFIFSIWLCIAGAVHGQESDCDPGVYVGKIGNVPVTMALDPKPDKSSEEPRVGSMYYRVSLIDMVLKQESKQPIWTEFDDDNTPSGRVALTCQDKQLTGQWESLDGKKRFPVVGTRSTDADYNTRRFFALQPTARPTDSKNRGTAFSVAGPKLKGTEEAVISAIQLFGTEPGVRKVNRLLWADLLVNTESLMGCASSFRQRFGVTPPALNFDQSLLHIAGPYVVVRSTIGFECGDGMRYGIEIANYRLNDGQKVDSSQWFKPELNTLWKEDWRTTPLSKLVLKVGRTQMDKDDAACFEAAEYWLSNVYPSPEGFVFRGSLSTPLQWCQGTVDVTLPYTRLAPFLSAEGKRAVQAIETGLRP